MAILTKAQLEALNQSSFPDQSTEAITPAILRTYNTATIDTLVDSLDTGSFITNTTALNAFTASQLSINSGLNASTASQQISINALNTNSASVNSSITILTAASASFEEKFATIGTQSGSWGSGGSVPAGTVSGSAQIIALGFQQTSSFNSYTSSTDSSISQLNASSASQQISINALNAATSSYATSAITASSLVTASVSGQTLTFTKGDASTFDVTLPAGSGSTSIPAGTVSGSAQVLAYGIFATTASNIFIGDQTITGSFSTNGGATIGNTSAQYNSVNIVTSKTNYPGNVYNAFNINTDGDGQWSAGMYVSTYNGFGSEPAAGLYGGGTGNAGSNNILESYGNLIRINKNTQLSGSLEVSASLKVNGSPVVVSSQTGSFVTSAITASSLVTASFSGNTLTFTKGDASTFGIVLPDVSGSNIPTGTVSSSAQILAYNIFATTGSNRFVGDQTISGSLLTNGGAIFGNNTSQYNSLTVSSSLATYPGNVFNSIGIDTDAGGQWSAGMYVSTYSSFGSQPQFGLYGGGNGNNGDNNVLNSYGNLITINKNTRLSGSLSVSSSFDAPLQNGYAYVGNANGRITQVPTSSFSSFTSGSVPEGTVSSSAQILNYGIFATTASNNFVGNQKILGGGSLSIQANAEGSGSAYSNAQLVIDMTTDPANIYSAFQAVDSSNSGVFGIGINSYNAKDGGAATFNIQGGGNVSGDNTILTVNPTTPGTLKFWKPETTFNSNVAVTGSTTLRTTRITGSLLTSGAFNSIVSAPGANSQTEWFTYGGFTGNNSVVYPTAFVGLQNFAGSDLDHAFAVTYANSDYTYFSGLKVGENNFGYYLGDGSGDYDYSKIEFVDNGNQTATATLKADNVNIQGATTITGATRITGSATIVGETTLTGSLKTNNSIIFNGNSSGQSVSSTGTTSIVGSNELRTTFTRNGSSDGSKLSYINDTGSFKSALEYETTSGGVTAGFYIQNLSGSSTTIFNTDVAEIHGNIQIQRGSTKPSGLVSVGSSGLTVSSSIVTSNSIVLVTTQNSSIAGNEYPAVVSNKTNGSFDISHNYAGTLEVGYLIINQAP